MPNGILYCCMKQGLSHVFSPFSISEIQKVIVWISKGHTQKLKNCCIKQSLNLDILYSSGTVGTGTHDTGTGSRMQVKFPQPSTYVSSRGGGALHRRRRSCGVVSGGSAARFSRSTPQSYAHTNNKHISGENTQQHYISLRVADTVHFRPDPAPDPAIQNFKNRIRILLALTKNQFKHLNFFHIKHISSDIIIFIIYFI